MLLKLPWDEGDEAFWASGITRLASYVQNTWQCQRCDSVPELRGRRLLLYLIEHFPWRCAMLLKCHKTATAGPGGSIPDTDQLQAQTRTSLSQREQHDPCAFSHPARKLGNGNQKQEKKLRNKSPVSHVQGDAAAVNFTAALFLVHSSTRRVAPACSGAHLGKFGRMAECKSECKSV